MVDEMVSGEPLFLCLVEYKDDEVVEEILADTWRIYNGFNAQLCEFILGSDSRSQ